ncbi:MAG: ParB/RepB/Spo0J family partition protein [Actinomycetota bacterium]
MTKKKEDIAGFDLIPVDKIDPNPDQPRTGNIGIPTLTRSVKELGVMVPIVTVKNGDRYQLVAGHRRLQAAKNNSHETIPSLVFDTLDRAGQVSRLMAENTVREDFTALEECRGFQTMLDLGIDVKAVATFTGRDQALIELARIVAPAADKLYEDLKGQQVTIEEAAALVEFQDDKKTYKKLVGMAGSDSFKHFLSQLRFSRDMKINVQETIDELTAAGVKISKESYITGAKRLSFMEVDDKPMTPEEHASCPGHIAYVSPYDASVEYWCTTPEVHGCVEKEYKPTPEQIAENKAREEHKAAFKAAEVVRVEHLKELIGKTEKLEGTILDFIASVVWQDGIEPAESYGQIDESLASLGISAPNSLQKLFVLAILGADAYVDGNASYLPDGFPSWKGQDELGGLVSYYMFLIDTGYTVADCEQRLIAAAQERIAEEAAIAESDEDPRD